MGSDSNLMPIGTVKTLLPSVRYEQLSTIKDRHFTMKTYSTSKIAQLAAIRIQTKTKINNYHGNVL